MKWMGGIVFNERLNIYVAIGGATAIAGVYLVNDSFRKKRESEKQDQQMSGSID